MKISLLVAALASTACSSVASANEFGEIGGWQYVPPLNEEIIIIRLDPRLEKAVYFFFTIENPDQTFFLRKVESEKSDPRLIPGVQLPVKLYKPRIKTIYGSVYRIA